MGSVFFTNQPRGGGKRHFLYRSKNFKAEKHPRRCLRTWSALQEYLKGANWTAGSETSQVYCTFPANWNIVFCECKAKMRWRPKENRRQCKKRLFLAWYETWLQFFVVYTVKNIAFPIFVWVQVFKPVALFQKWQWPFFTVPQTTLSGVSCAHGHKGKAAKCEVWPIMAYAHSGPMYLVFWPRRPAGCWFTSTARTVGVITKTYAVYKYKHRSDINTCQP